MEGIDNNKDSNLFKQGFFDGLPIGLGYIPLGVALGITAVKVGVVYWIWQFVNLILYSGSAMAAVLNLVSSSEVVVFTYVLTFITVNCRYLLLALTLSQKLDPEMNLLQRIIVGFFNTDEIFAVVMQRQGKLKASYMFGISVLPYTLMMTAVGLGYFLTNLMPASVSSAFGITLYAMFLALIIPPCRTSKPALFVVSSSAILSFILEGSSFIRKILPSAGWIIIICSLVTASLGAIFFPIKPEGNIEEN